MAKYKSGGVGDLHVGLGTGVKVITLPFVANDNVETTTEWDLPAKSVVLYCFVEITAADGTETLDIGVLSDDPNAIATAVVLDATGLIQDSDALPYTTETNTALTVSYTCTAGSDTAAGNIHLVYANLNN